MAEFHGTVELAAGITPKNGGSFALVGAHDVQVDDQDTRLDYKLHGFKRKIDDVIVNTTNLFNPYDITIGVTAAGSQTSNNRALSGPIYVGEHGFSVKAVNKDSNLRYSIEFYNDETVDSRVAAGTPWITTDQTFTYTFANKPYPYIRIYFGTIDESVLAYTIFDTLVMQVNTGTTLLAYERPLEAHDKTARNEIAVLKSETLEGNVYSALSFEIVNDEYVSANTGEILPYAEWSRSGYIEINPAFDYDIISTYNNKYNVYYDANKTRISNFTLNEGKNKLVIPGRAKYMILSARTAVFNPEINQIIPSYYYIKTDLIKSVMEEKGVIVPDNWVIGSLSSGVQAESWKRLTSDYLEVDGNTRYRIIVNTDYRAFVTQFDANKAFISESGYLRADYFTTSDNTAYVKITVKKAIDANLDHSDAAKAGVFLYIVNTPIYLNVMSYNMGHYAYGTGMGLTSDIYNEKLTNYRRFLGKYYPDVLAIQEYDSRMDAENTIWSDDVLFSYYYPYAQNTGSQESLKTRYNLTEKQTAQLSTGRYYVKGYIEVNDKKILLLNVHLSVGTEAVETRATESREIINLIPANTSCIIFGDFNAEPGEEDSLFKIYSDAGLNLANCGWFGKYYTWSNNRDDFNHYDTPTGSKLYYVDNIITTNDLKITKVEVLPEVYNYLSSDHIPIVARIEI